VFVRIAVHFQILQQKSALIAKLVKSELQKGLKAVERHAVSKKHSPHIGTL